MHFLQTNAVNLNGLLIALKTFLAANGWTVLADGTGGGGLTLEMTNGNGHSFSFASITQAQNDWSTGVSVGFNDRLLRIAYQKSNIGMAAGYTAKPADTNDMAGPFPNLWFVTDNAASYCHVVAQTGNARYAHFSFGDLNNRGLHAVNLPYAFGLYYVYWQWNPWSPANSIDYNAFIDPRSGSHHIGFYCEQSTTENIAFTGNCARVGIPNGLLDTALGFTAGAIEAPILRQLDNRNIAKDPSGVVTGHFLDFLHQYDNQGYTGGVPIFPCSIIVADVPDAAHTVVGEYPGIGQVNMDGLSPGQELDFGAEAWLAFPLKQAGTYAGMNGGISPQPITNSLNYGIAIKKA